MSDRVTRAMGVVERARYCFDGRGGQLPQTSAPEVIARMLRLLDVGPGAGVLEIGIGSGYSTALLAELVGPEGRVVSLDVDPQLTERARALLEGQGYRQVCLSSGDGRDGWPAGAPYDRIIAWGSVTAIPDAWLEQSAPGAILVVPMRGEGQRPWIAAYRRSGDSALVERERFAGGFIALTAEPFRPWEQDAP